MAVKCNITTKVKERIALGTWGMSRDMSVDKAVLENYIEYLSCPNISLKSCNDYSDTCDSINSSNGSLVVFNCNINLTSLSFNTISNDNKGLEFFVAIGDIYGAKQPISYLWSYNTAHFDIVGDANLPKLTLKTKAGIDANGVISQISLQVTDANGCTDTKSCFYTSTGMKCNANYKPCYPPKGLQVSYHYSACKAPKGLVVIYNHSTVDTPQQIYVDQYVTQFI